MTQAMTAAQAIEQSIMQTETVDLPYYEAVALDLLVECDDSVDGNAVTEYWGTTDDGEQWRVHMALPQHVRCECGTALGERCEWTGDPRETVIVEWMPEYLRASHRAAGHAGRWPANGAIHLRCEQSCAELLTADEDDAPWARIIG